MKFSASRQASASGSTSTTQREERRNVNDPCIWRKANVRILHRGVIVNESASGILLRASNLPPAGSTIQVLPLIDGESADEYSFQGFQRHPLSRTGTVVRMESGDSVGVRWKDDQKAHHKFKRWFRNNAELALLQFNQQLVIRLRGPVGLEAAALLQSIFNSVHSSTVECLFLANEVGDIHPAALTIIRSSLQSLEKRGLIVSALFSEDFRGKQERFDSILNHSQRLMSTDEVLGQEIEKLQKQAVSFPDAGEETVEKPPSEAPEEPIAEAAKTALATGRMKSSVERLARLAERIGLEAERVVHLKEGVHRSIDLLPDVLLIEYELGNCGQLLEFNRIPEFTDGYEPMVILVGPAEVQPLAIAALDLPVRLYQPLPWNERELEGKLAHLIEPGNRSVEENRPSGGREALL